MSRLHEIRPMTEFLVALALFLLSHAIPARPAIRQRLVATVGERAYLICYSFLSLALLAWLIDAARRAPFVAIWELARWQYFVPLALMLPASMLLVGGAISANPLSVTFSRATYDPARPGLVAVTRHPLLWAFALWAFGHLVPNGDLVGLVMFGGFGLFACAGMAAIDRRRRRVLGRGAWQEIAAQTSIMPGAALLSGRARWRWRIAPLCGTMVGGALLYVTLLIVHPLLIGPDPLAAL